MIGTGPLRSRPGRHGDAGVLDVVLGDDAEARAAWRAFAPGFDLDLVAPEVQALLPALASRLLELRIDDPAMPRLLGLRRRAWYSNSLLFADLTTALHLLSEARAPALVIRGAVTALAAYPHPGDRTLRAIDVLVRPSGMVRAIEVLGHAGWACAVPPREGGSRRGVAVLHREGSRTLRLHDALSTSLPGTRHDPELWSHAVTIAWNGSGVPAPAAEERLLRLCVDGVEDDDLTLLHVTDVVMTVRTADVDWDRFARLVQDQSASLQAWTALDHAAREYGAPVPATALERIRATPVTGWERFGVLARAPTAPAGRLRRAMAHLSHTADRGSPALAAHELRDTVRRLPRQLRRDGARTVRRRSGRVGAVRVAVAAVRALHDTPGPVPLEDLLRRTDVRSLPHVADHHHVVGHLHHALAPIPDLDHRTRVRLASLHLHAVQRHRRALDDLRTLHDVFDAAGVTWLVVKGPVLSETVYPRSDLRVYNDLDVVVPGRQLARAIASLRGADYELTDRNWRLVRDRVAAEVHLQRAGGAEVDLHWHLLFSQRLRAQFRLDVDEMIARAVPVAIDGVRASTFDPADTLIHLALHAALEGGDRLVWMADLHGAARQVSDWDAVMERARRWQVHLPVGAVLLRSHRVLGAPVPPEVVAGLLPNPLWRGTLALAYWGCPLGASRDRGNPATLLVRSSRSTVAATLTTAWSGAVRRARRVASENTLERLDVRGDPTHPGSLLYPSGGEDEFDAYLDAVGAAR